MICKCKICDQCKRNIDIGEKFIRHFYGLKDNEPVNEDHALESGNDLQWALNRPWKPIIEGFKKGLTFKERISHPIKLKRYEEDE